LIWILLYRFPIGKLFFDLLKALKKTGQFVPENASQRLRFIKNGLPIDLIPFGSIGKENGMVCWPPDYHTELEIIGFEEAWKFAIPVLIDEKLSLVVKCISIAGLTVLKLIAWDSRNTNKEKDATDLFLFLKYYAEIGNMDRLYSEEILLLEQEDFNVEMAGIRLLGNDVGRMVKKRTRDRIMAILERETDENGQITLIGEMIRYFPEKENSFRSNLIRLQKLKQGIEEIK